MVVAKSNADTANAQFKKSQREQDGRRATAEYEAEGIAQRAKTAKLRALRLEHEAKLAAAAPPPAPVRAKKSAKKAKPKAAPLSDFLKARDDSGHNR